MMIEPQWRFTEQENRLKTIKITIMKKLFTFFAIILSVGMANAQTKEETIAWLKDKLSKYIMGRDYDPERFTDIALMSIDENKIVFVYKFNYF